MTALSVASEIRLDGIDVDRPVSLAYLEPRRSLLVGSGDEELAVVTLFGDKAGTVALGEDAAGDVASVYHALLREYLVWRSGDPFLTAVVAKQDGGPSDEVTREMNVRALAVGDPAQVVVAPATGDLFLRDVQGSPILRIPFDGERVRRSERTFDLGASCQLRPALPDASALGPMAVDPATGHIFAFDSRGTVLHELMPDGRLVATHSVAEVGLQSPLAATFAPPANPQHGSRPALYVADGVSEADRLGRVVELALAPPAAPPVEHLSLVSVTRTRDWAPPSVDPGGIAYDPYSGALVVTDPEVDELALFAGANFFEFSVQGMPVAIDLTQFVTEPTGVIVDPETGDYYVTDDAEAKVYRFGRGEDGRVGTDDDRVSSFSIAEFGATDLEGVAAGQGSLFLAGGVDGAIYRLIPGPNREFDGAPPAGDDTLTSFDVAELGISDPEAVEYDPLRGTLYLVADDGRLVEVGTDGTLIRSLDLGSLPLISPSGLALGPSSDDPSRRSLYLVDRGLDQAADPDQRDGLVVELRFEGGPTPHPIENGGFEADIDGDGTLDGWELEGGSVIGGSDVHSGDRAIMLSSTDAEAAAHYQLAPLPEPGDQTSYTFDAWMRTLPGTTAEVKIRVAWRDRDGSRLTSDRILTVVGPEWTNASATFTPPAGTVDARITLSVALGGAVIVDDVSFDRSE